MLNLKELRDGVVQGWWEMFICWFGVCGNACVNKIHKSHDILICKIFLLRKCQSRGRSDCLDELKLFIFMLSEKNGYLLVSKSSILHCRASQSDVTT